MTRYLLVFILLAFFIKDTTAQTLYMPRDVTEAFIKGTRSPDGKPGKNYWQNFGRYNIHITAKPPVRAITGEEEITYINNSPDTLKSLVIKLFMNGHKPGAARQGDASDDYLTSGVHIDEVTVNGATYNWEEPTYHSTWQTLKLDKPLLQKDSVQLTFKWHYDMSLQSGREGMIDSTTFFVAYFYPRVAVYDDYNGWDKFTFTGSQEFYSDFNDYTFSVTVPKNYIVWATGTLLNAEEVLQPTYVQRLNASMKTDSILHVANLQELESKNVTTANELNTWKWKADYVPDVALGLSDHFVWDASSIVVDSSTQRRASVQAAYNDTAKDFHYMVSFGRKSLSWLSFHLPGVPYPYEKTTVFQGYAGMEYPMMANDESYSDTTFSKFVAEHEIAHTYFPFYMGTNETRYGFMDEGWATTFEYFFNIHEMGKEAADEFYKTFRVQGWAKDPSADASLPIITPATNLTGIALGSNEYGKPSLCYIALKDMLGDDLFKKSLHEYMNRWHGKHPIPWDFFNSFSNASGRDLNWFWSNWYFSNNYIDIAVQNVTSNNRGSVISIKNIGGFAIPFDVVVNYADGTTDTLHQTAEVWKADQKQTNVTINGRKKINRIELSNGIFMDADTGDNVWTNK